MSADFVTDLVALGTIMKGADPAPHKGVDELVDDLLTYAYLSQDLFERSSQVLLGTAIAKVCLDYVERDMFTIAASDNKKNLIIADYMFHEGDFEKAVAQPLFQKDITWPDFLIFYDPKNKQGGVVSVGFILNQFAQAISNEPRSLVSPEDFERALALSPETPLEKDDINAVEKIVSLMISKRLFTERQVQSTQKGGKPFLGWYFCKGCFQSYIEKSISGCKGAAYVNNKGELAGKCGSLKRKPHIN